MKKFEFRLERALEWRTKRFEVERDRQQVLLAELAAIDSDIREREAAALTPCDAVMTGRELTARQYFHDRLRRELEELATRRQGCVKRLDEQNQVVVTAHRDVRLLERLKETARERWQAAADLELDQLASEAYLAQWSRRMRDESRRG